MERVRIVQRGVVRSRRRGSLLPNKRGRRERVSRNLPLSCRVSVDRLTSPSSSPSSSPSRANSPAVTPAPSLPTALARSDSALLRSSRSLSLLSFRSFFSFFLVSSADAVGYASNLKVLTERSLVRAEGEAVRSEVAEEERGRGGGRRVPAWDSKVWRTLGSWEVEQELR